MGKTDAQIAVEQRFLVITMLVIILLTISVIVVALNWGAWFNRDVPATPTTSQNETQEADEIAGNRNDQR